MTFDDEHHASPSRGGPLARAAEYVRMSMDHQRYSTENQADAIRHYAAARDFEIVRTYADAGKRGASGSTDVTLSR